MQPFRHRAVDYRSLLDNPYLQHVCSAPRYARPSNTSQHRLDPSHVFLALLNNDRVVFPSHTSNLSPPHTGGVQARCNAAVPPRARACWLPLMPVPGA